RSDIYSLGLVFYEVLSGTVPLAGMTALETMSLHMSAMPPSLQKAAAERQEIPLPLENIVFKMLERNRDKRYQTMLEIRQDLRQFATGQQEALSGNITYVRRELSRKSRVLAAAMISSAVLILAGIIAFPYACSVQAQHDYQQGSTLLKKGKFQEAEPFLKA